MNRTLGAAVLAAATFAALFFDVARQLVSDWATDDNSAHGFLVVPVALFLAWERRDALAAAPRRPSVLGLVVVFGSLAVLAAGTLGAELFLTRIAIVGVLVGVVLFALGWHHLRLLAFPLAFLLLMVPLPAILFNQIALPLQLLASQVGEEGLRAFGVPVLREGTVMVLASTTLEVAEACSGIRSLISLLTLGIVYGYFMDSRAWVRWVLALSTVPIAVVTNGLRVAGTGIAAHHYGPEAAEGFLHTFSGWLVFVSALALLFVLREALARLSPDPELAAPLAAGRATS
ncbi:MAG: exosortase [Acidobacteria bacterium]|nr:exosortase [Acidobacteriota bacterium]